MVTSLRALQDEIDRLEQNARDQRDQANDARRNAAQNMVDNDSGLVDTGADMVRAQGFEQQAQKFEQQIETKRREMSDIQTRVTQLTRELDEMRMRAEQDMKTKQDQIRELTGEY